MKQSELEVKHLVIDNVIKKENNNIEYKDCENKSKLKMDIIVGVKNE